MVIHKRSCIRSSNQCLRRLWFWLLDKVGSSLVVLHSKGFSVLGVGIGRFIIPGFRESMLLLGFNIKSWIDTTSNLVLFKTILGIWIFPLSALWFSLNFPFLSLSLPSNTCFSETECHKLLKAPKLVRWTLWLVFMFAEWVWLNTSKFSFCFWWTFADCHFQFRWVIHRTYWHYNACTGRSKY